MLVKYCREELEMTQQELGYVFGVHESTVSGWETGKDAIPQKKLVKLSNLCGESIDYITGLKRKSKKYKKLNKINKKLVGENLKKLRKSLSLTQQEIADVCNISQTAYSNYENGLYLINSMTLYTICKTYNVSWDEILGRTEDVN